MKVFSVCGITKSGKTTTIEKIIAELCKRGYRVGSVKEIHFEEFAIDASPQSNTHRHRKAGAELVTARGYYETDLLYPQKLDMEKILGFYEGDYDYVVLEGVDDIPVPTVVTAHAPEDLQLKLNGFTFCVSGRISDEISEYDGIPAINAVADIKALVDHIELKVYDRLPDFSPDCCTACGMTCAELGQAILRGAANRGQCAADRGIGLTVDGKRIKMVPFVQSVLQNSVLAVVKELDGYVPGKEILISMGGEWDFKRFVSKRNEVFLSGGVVGKRVASADAALLEADILKKLRACEMDVPDVLDVDKNTIRLGYIPGQTLPDFLEGCSRGDMYMAAKRLTEWLKDFYAAVEHDRTGEIRGDVNGRNFIISEGNVWGVDFEEHTFGVREQDAGRLLAFADTYAITDREKQRSFVLALQKELAISLALDLSLVAHHWQLELEAMRKRRRLEA